MKTAIKLVLIDLLIAQIIAPILIMCADYCSNPDYDSLYDLFVSHHRRFG